MSPDFFCLELDLQPILQPVYKLYIWVDVFFILESFFIINLRPFTSTLPSNVRRYMREPRSC
ncbi:hypothetical protein ACU8KH_00700 [Lachancea thermotolerans]